MQYWKNNFIYFLKGGDQRLLNPHQQTTISRIIRQNISQKSFYIYNPNQTKLRLRAWKRDLPNVRPYYAVKANPCSELIGGLGAMGVGMDCASENQIRQCLDLGILPQNIVYSNPTKCETDLQYAHASSIPLTAADTLHELQKILKFAPKMTILWRISVQQNKQDNLACSFSNKFGDNLQNEEDIRKRMRDIREMGVNLGGIHFHCGSGMNGASAFGRGVELAGKCVEIGRREGHLLGVLDVGGGFPAGKIRSHVIDPLNSPLLKELNLTVIAEPGRYFCSRSFYLLTRIIGQKYKDGKHCYFLNDSIYHSFRLTEADSFYFQKSTDQFYSKIDQDQVCSTTGEAHLATFVGMTCDGTDVITKQIYVPKTLKIGDWLCIGGTGAYTYSCLSNFNGMSVSNKFVSLQLDLPQDQY